MTTLSGAELQVRGAAFPSQWLPALTARRVATRRLLGCDPVFGCTDNQLSRAVLNAMAFQFYPPVIDLGVELQAAAMGGRVAWLAPGGACLWCMGVLDPEAVRVKQLPPALRRYEEARGYILGHDEPAPAVVSINGVIASLGVTEMLARLTGFAGAAARSSLLLYRLADGVVRRTSPRPGPARQTCSAAGIFGAGDLAPPRRRARLPRTTSWSTARSRACAAPAARATQ